MLDFCTQKFRSEHCFKAKGIIGEPPTDRVPLLPAKRAWISIRFSGFKKDPVEPYWVSQINGQRSDGRLFVVTSAIPEEFEPEGDHVEWVMRRLRNKLRTIDEFKDCSCGIIGYEKTEEKDEDGDYILRTICSPCEQHPPLPKS